MTLTHRLGREPQELRAYLQDSDSADMRLRRGVVATALVGIGAMALTTMLQTGIVRRLPELKLPGFDTRKVNSSEEAYSWGGPDSPIAILMHGANLVLASTGGGDRARRQPWLPLLATAVALGQGATAWRYLFHQMPKVDRAWCPYCILEALSTFTILGLTLPEAVKAVSGLASRNR